MAFWQEWACAVIGVACAVAEPAVPEPETTIPDGYLSVPEPPVAEPAPPPPAPAPGRLAALESLEFGTVRVDAGAERRHLALRNVGGRSVAIAGIEVTGSGAFSVEHRCATIAPGAVCAATVAFQPTLDVAYSGSVVVGWNGQFARADIRGEGAFPPAPPPEPEPAPVVKAPPPPAPDLDRLRALAQARAVLEAAIQASVAVGRPAARPLDAGELTERRSAAALVLSTESFPGDKEDGRFPGDVSTFPVQRCRIVSADTFIPLVLDQTVHTQISGPMLAHTDRDVYGADGRLVLIPRGTKFRGEYDTLEQQGDTRPVARWLRLTRPDGASIALTSTGAADAQGRAGLTGVVDNRFYEKYGTVIAASTISAVVALATQGDTSSDGTTTDGTFTAAGQALSQNLSQVTAEALRNAANLAPRVTVAKGTLVYAQPGRDWYFPNPRQLVELSAAPDAFDYGCTGDGFFRDRRGIAQNAE